MRTMHVGAKIVHTRLCTTVTSQALLKRRGRVALHNDTKNITKGAGMTNTQMIKLRCITWHYSRADFESARDELQSSVTVTAIDDTSNIMMFKE